MAAVVELNRVRYRYPTAGWVLDDIECHLPAGQSTLVLGASGSGKSTLAYLLNGLIPHFFGGTLEGSVAARNHIGGTAPQQVASAVVQAKLWLGMN